MRVADYIADFLADAGIADVFTVTGGGAMHLNDAFGNHPRLRCTYFHHEQAAAIAAEGYFKASGRIPLVCVTTGPGGTNALTGVLGAWLDSVPMLVISGQVKFECTLASVPGSGLRQLGDQEFNIVDAVRPMTKRASMLTEPDTVRRELEEDLFLARAGRPGPVWLDIPLNVQAAQIELGFLAPSEPRRADPATPSMDAVAAFLERLRAAKRPAMIGGAGVRLAGAAELYPEFARALNVPALTAWNSHDLITDDDPLYAGRPGTIGTRGGNYVFQNCDLLLVLGCRMNLRQIGYAWDDVARGAYKVMVDIDPAETRKKTFRVDLPIIADCRLFMEAVLSSGYRKEYTADSRWLAWCREMAGKYPAAAEASPTEGLNPYAFFDAFLGDLPEGQTTVCSNGSACVIPFQTARIKRGQRLFTNSGCASMGYGLPAAIGACRALDGRKVICIEGDGSLQMNVQELATVAHNRLPLKLVVVNNGGYHSIRQTQGNFFKGRYAGIDPASGLGFPDFRALAVAYGLAYLRVANADQAVGLADRLLADNAPILCEVLVDKAQPFSPKSSSSLLPDGRMVSAPLDEMHPFLTKKEHEANAYREGGT
jgi:acetolactate synthase-1/2/3 large subunit